MFSEKKPNFIYHLINGLNKSEEVLDIFPNKKRKKRKL